MRSLHHVSVTVATSAELNFITCESSMIFGTTDLTFVFIITGKSHFTDRTCVWHLGESCQSCRHNHMNRSLLVGTPTTTPMGGLM